MDISPLLLLSWGIAAVIRVCVGSATVAGLTTVGILAPLAGQRRTCPPELLVLAIGSGSLMFSHLNDGGFWLFKEYFNLSIKDTHPYLVGNGNNCVNNGFAGRFSAKFVPIKRPTAR
jgi:Gnt-I system high-affinity gluconate transporter